MNSLDDLLIKLSDLDEVKKFRRLDSLIKQDEELFKKYDLLHEISKNLVNAKELGLENAIKKYQMEYDKILEELEDNVLFCEYTNSKDEIKNIIKTITDIIEADLNNALKNDF